ncbi:MAG: FtsW/RodA/SpoVE family cell cycle protein [Ruminococcus sp.]
MKRKEQTSGKESSRYTIDMTLLALVLILLIVGLALLYSTSAYNGRVKFHDPAYYFKKQLFATALGLLALYLVSQIDYHVIVKLAYPVYFTSLLLSTAVLFFGQEYNGSKRWLALGPLSFQPAEFAKVAVVVFLARIISERKKGRDSIWWMLKTMAALLPIVALVGTNNLSTAIIILGIGVILIFVSSSAICPLFGWELGDGFLAIFLGMESYRLERLAIWRNPEKYEKGFQTIQGYTHRERRNFWKRSGKQSAKIGICS